MSEALTLELLNRIINLETRVNALENNTTHHTYEEETPMTAGTTHPAALSTAARGATRAKALKTLSTKLAAASIEGTLTGNGNRGNNRLYFQTPTGEKKYIYLSTSRNYADPGTPFSSWHTISPSDITQGTYDIFILSAEDEAGDPLLFVYTAHEMNNYVARKTPDNRPYYHFYLTRDAEDGYEDWRKDPNYPVQNITDHYENWTPFTS
ncbi:hypothetical protein [Rothia nasimurium]|uniref:hypothetical protein n=1 Tax=Rothia nasimurium TaxID=85336 RepID=UPI001F2BE2FD|nr:hypothetical protein [Rothia nasimurium]